MNLGLVGKAYIDTIVYLDSFMLGETNPVLRIDFDCLGGMYNISDIDGVNPVYFSFGKKNSLIISESHESRRTSIVQDDGDTSTQEVNLDELDADWMHIIYVDDTNINISVREKPMSIDFCTLQDRNTYDNTINQSEIIFDSRERKSLYQNISCKTPIVLHDENGCECIVLGKKEFCSEIKPVLGLNVNGAGDIFASIFIREYLKGSLKSAVETTSQLTTMEILKRNE